MTRFNVGLRCRERGRGPKGWAVAFAVVLYVSAAWPLRAEVIYQENFIGGTSSLAGTSPDISIGGGVWNGGTKPDEQGGG